MQALVPIILLLAASALRAGADELRGPTYDFPSNFRYVLPDSAGPRGDSAVPSQADKARALPPLGLPKAAAGSDKPAAIAGIAAGALLIPVGFLMYLAGSIANESPRCGEDEGMFGSIGPCRNGPPNRALPVIGVGIALSGQALIGFNIYNLVEGHKARAAAR